MEVIGCYSEPEGCWICKNSWGTSWGMAGFFKIAYGPNRLDCFVKGGENHLWHKCWDGAQWRDWEDMGGTITSAPAVAARGEQILEIFALGAKNQLIHMGGDGDSHWMDWEDLGGE